MFKRSRVLYQQQTKVITCTREVGTFQFKQPVSSLHDLTGIGPESKVITSMPSCAGTWHALVHTHHTTNHQQALRQPLPLQVATSQH